MDTEHASAAILRRTSTLITSEAKGGHFSKRDTGERTKNILIGCQQVLEIVDQFSDAVPGGRYVIFAAKAVLNIEMSRRENSEQISVIFHYMTTMVEALTLLDGPNAPQKTEGLQAVLTKMTNAVNEFGALADYYYTKCKSHFVKYMRSGDIRGKLNGCIDTFKNCREDLIFQLQIRQDKMQQDVLESQKQMSTDVEKILQRLSEPAVQNPEELRQIEIAKGGIKEILADDEMMERVAGMFKESITPGMFNALHGQLDTLLEENKAAFMLKLDAAKDEIKDSIDQSTQAILRRLDEGPHQLIDDPDIRALWQQSGWKLGVKCRTFVNGLCLYLFMKLHNASNSGEVPPDAWTVRVLSKVNNHNAIGEVIDEDASGYLSVHEVNHFINQKPKDWSTPVWFVHAAVGWKHINHRYLCYVEDQFVDVKDTARGLARSWFRRDLEKPIKEYIDMLKLVRLTFQPVHDDGKASRSANSLSADDSVELESLIAISSQNVETKMKEKLEKVNYNLDDTALLPSITGTSNVRMEQVFLILVHLVLKEHKARIVGKLTSRESSKIFEMMTEWESMKVSLATLLLGFHDRMEALTLSWRSLKLDVNVEIESYSNGFFHGWHRDYTTLAPTRKVRPFLAQQRESSGQDEEVEEVEKTQLEILLQRLDKLETMIRQFTTPFSNVPGVSLLHRSNSTDDGGGSSPSSPRIDPGEWKKQALGALQARSPFASPKQETPPKIPASPPAPARANTGASDASIPASPPASSPPSSPPATEGKREKGSRFGSFKGISGSLLK